MQSPHLRVLLAFSALLVSFSTNAVAVEEPVQLTHGQVSGVELDDGVTVFRGIPFAAPPVGDLRWKAPQPPIPWQGVKAADTFGPACMQRRAQLMSEDCLYLNVWTKAETDQDALPVMVWIHGGGWSSGATAGATYDGFGFADKGVVLVSVNYRMNAFGFMAHPALSAESERGVSGNYGILDHIAALEWVRDNIGGFGGDPDNVTIFGESAGGASIYALLATPLANGLFHRAISESTWITTTNVTHLTRHNGFSDSAEARGQQAIADKLTELGRSRNGDPLATMREMTADDIMSMRFSVSLAEDGWVLPKSPDEIFSEGSHNVVPLLAGVNNGEGLFFVRPERTFSTLEEQKQARLEQWGEHGQGLATFYLAKTEDAIFTTEVDYSTDSLFARPNRQILTAMAKTPAETFMYLFTRNLTDPSLRSPHAMELRYVFQTLPGEATETDHSISQLISDYWVQFATTGNPNGDNLPQWPAYDADTQQHQIIGAEVGQGSGFRRQELDELDRYFDATHAGAQP
ncbi:MAG: carboxylesterase [Acidobacteria bacterium]|jgi:para-nitrobenzyl esterase|nr:carboxylesterase [Acidobacteriota bacterium]HJN46403.1 carboxylesterase family protein [Vicinamibacterales bacterium]|tara:strand:- start:762 stop:2315 length:1554 start_codon:yes stop_codon:yes gene_type:complete